jgi:hypothetical protein
VDSGQQARTIWKCDEGPAALAFSPPASLRVSRIVNVRPAPSSTPAGGQGPRPGTDLDELDRWICRAAGIIEARELLASTAS